MKSWKSTLTSQRICGRFCGRLLGTEAWKRLLDPAHAASQRSHRQKLRQQNAPLATG